MLKQLKQLIKQYVGALVKHAYCLCQPSRPARMFHLIAPSHRLLAFMDHPMRPRTLHIIFQSARRFLLPVMCHRLLTFIVPRICLRLIYAVSLPDHPFLPTISGHRLLTLMDKHVCM